MDNPEKLATRRRKKNKNTTQYLTFDQAFGLLTPMIF
jgi:hypothetical protein